MGFSDKQKAFITESYFRSGKKIGGKWKYSVKDCLNEFKSQYPEVAVDYKSFQSTLMRCVKNFRETGSVQRKEGSGRPCKRNPDLIEGIRQIMDEAPETSVRVLSRITGVSVGTCHKILKDDIKQNVENKMKK